MQCLVMYKKIYAQIFLFIEHFSYLYRPFPSHHSSILPVHSHFDLGNENFKNMTKIFRDVKPAA